jgi:hypothetical protein
VPLSCYRIYVRRVAEKALERRSRDSRALPRSRRPGRAPRLLLPFTRLPPLYPWNRNPPEHVGAEMRSVVDSAFEFQQFEAISGHCPSEA